MARETGYCVYIMASRTRTLYIGVTNNLLKRVIQHKQKKIPGFTHRYNVTRLVYFEQYSGYRSSNHAREAAQGPLTQIEDQFNRINKSRMERPIGWLYRSTPTQSCKLKVLSS